MSYPRSDYDDPEGALATYVSVLEDYSDAVVAFVTSPKTGIQRRIKFPPRVAELVAACNSEGIAIAERKRFDNWGHNDDKALEGPQEPRPSLEELKAKYGENYGLDPIDGNPAAVPSVPAPTWDRIAETYGADPSRIKALTETEFMNRKSTTA